MDGPQGIWAVAKYTTAKIMYGICFAMTWICELLTLTPTQKSEVTEKF